MSASVYKIATTPKLKKVFEDLGFRVSATEKKLAGGKVEVKTSLIDKKGRGQTKTVIRPAKRVTKTTTTTRKYVPRK